jgi:hypothetical protein
MKIMGVLLLLLFPITGFASDIGCYGWYQVAGGNVETVSMPVVSRSANGITYSATYKGYTYTADWDFQLTSFNVSFETSSSRILSTTARVPTDNHRENFTDLNLPSGPRLSITCELK